MYLLMLVLTMVAQSSGILSTWAIEWPALVGPNKGPVPDRIQLIFFNRGGGITSDAFAFDPSVFRGLTAAQMASPVRTAARFDIVREAGTFTCEGYFESGRGRGTFLFQPNPAFRGEMLALGFQDVSETEFLQMALHEVGPQYVLDLRALGVAVSTASQVLNMRVQGITIDFVREMKAMFLSASAQDIVNMRVQGVTPEFARQMRQTFPSASIRDLINMRAQGIRGTR